MNLADKHDLYGKLTQLESENTILKLHLKTLLRSIKRNTDRDFFNWCLQKLGGIGEQLGFKPFSKP